MAIPHTITGVIESAKRLRSTVNGNPRVRVTIRDDFGGLGSFNTEPDSSYVTDVLNETENGFGVRDPRQRYRFHLNGRGAFGNLERIERIER